MSKSNRITSAQLAKIAPGYAQQLKKDKKKPVLTEAQKQLKQAESLANKEAATAKRKALYKLLALSNIPEPQHEFRFHPKRLWPFDFAWPLYKIALEVEGGIWKKNGGGRHNRPTGFLGDMEKYNTASSMGWIIIRTTPSELLKPKTIDLIRATITTIREQKL